MTKRARRARHRVYDEPSHSAALQNSDERQQRIVPRTMPQIVRRCERKNIRMSRKLSRLESLNSRRRAVSDRAFIQGKAISSLGRPITFLFLPLRPPPRL